ncbi:UreD urease accessory protein-domain-containing protein [Melanogaster broomeanus]|nr:UreD urease accessory protein-domain-containing protein [Melanogaster broomeanus]
MAASSSRQPGDDDRLIAGHGRITCSLHGSSVVFSELSSTYPLKLLSPRLAEDAVAIVYVLCYGGGLVSGDRVKLEVDVERGCKLLLLSQGSTKVFKTRPGIPASTQLRQPAQLGILRNVTTQIMNVTIAPKSAVFLLPDPVTCFRSASYTQIQRFHLLGDASLVLLDWVTSGRKSLGEEWAFSRYYSVNEVFLDGRRITRDVTLLEDPSSQTQLPSGMQGTSRTLSERLKPYSCYATLILCGPLAQEVTAQLSKQYQSISIFKTTLPARMIWALSPVEEGRTYVVRAAGVETEDVKSWLRESLRGFEDAIGIDTYRKVFV